MPELHGGQSDGAQLASIIASPETKVVDFPPMQDPASYKLEQVMQQVREMKPTGPAGD
jgi:hypothetical protein